jgi:hypothetical protein
MEVTIVNHNKTCWNYTEASNIHLAGGKLMIPSESLVKRGFLLGAVGQPQVQVFRRPDSSANLGAAAFRKVMALITENRRTSSSVC